MAKPPKNTAKPPKNTAKAMYDAHWKADSTAMSNFADSVAPIVKRQIRSGNDASLDSARKTVGVLSEKFETLKGKYPNKSMIKK